MKPNSFIRKFLVLSCCSVMTISSAHAQLFWDADGNSSAATGGTGAWLSSSTWRSGSSTGTLGNWVTNNSAVFAGGDGTYTVTVGADISLATGSETAAGLQFNNSGYTLSATSSRNVTVASGGFVNVASGKSAIIGNNISLATGGTGGIFFGGGGTLRVDAGGAITSTSSSAAQVGLGTTLHINGGTATFAASLSVGRVNLASPHSTNGDGHLLIDSGSLLIGGSGNLTLARTNGDSTSVTINGGSINVAAGNLSFGANSQSGNGTVHLNGGSITVRQVLENAGNTPTSTFNFNGGTLIAQTSANSAFMTGLDTVNVRNGGARIDSNSQSITIGQALLHSNIGGDNAIDGGLTKIGAGTLTLTGANTYTGATTLNQGTLTVGTGGTLGSSTAALSVNNTNNTAAGTNAILNLATAVDTTVGSLSGTIATPTSGTNTATINTQTGRNFTVNQTANGTYAGVIAGAGNFTKTGNGTLTLTGTNTYTGATTISGGSVALTGAGSIASSSSITINSSTSLNVTGLTGDFTVGASQSLGGSGTLTATGKTVIASGTLTPGNSPGTLTQDGGTLQLAVGGDLNWQVYDASGPAGVGGYDTVSLINGATLDLSVLSAGNTYNINLWSLSSIGPDVNGNAINFNNTLNYAWTLFSTGSVISDFNTNLFTINTGAFNGTSGFSNTLNGSFSVGLADGGTDLVLTYTAIPEPTTALLGSLGLLFLLRRRRIN